MVRTSGMGYHGTAVEVGGHHQVAECSVDNSGMINKPVLPNGGSMVVGFEGD